MARETNRDAANIVRTWVQRYTKFLISRKRNSSSQKVEFLELKLAKTPKCHCELAGEGKEYSWG
jgi:hypothetical protein